MQELSLLLAAGVVALNVFLVFTASENISARPEI
jgi:hypothetical protein